MSARQYAILVKHGGGEERLNLPTVNMRVTANIIASLPSDEAYLLMHHLFDVWRDARSHARKETERTYREAFADGRLKKRRLPAQGVTKVWIVTKEEAAALAEVDKVVAAGKAVTA